MVLADLRQRVEDSRAAAARRGESTVNFSTSPSLEDFERALVAAHDSYRQRRGDDDEAFLKDVRAQHHPYFAKLEAMFRQELALHQAPQLDDLTIAYEVCAFLDELEIVVEQVRRDMNPDDTTAASPHPNRRQ